MEIFHYMIRLLYSRYMSNINRTIKDGTFKRESCKFLSISDSLGDPARHHVWLRKNDGMRDQLWRFDCYWAGDVFMQFDGSETEGNVLVSNTTSKHIAIESHLGNLWIINRTQQPLRGIPIANSTLPPPKKEFSGAHLSQQNVATVALIRAQLQDGETILWTGKSSAPVLFPEIEIGFVYLITNKRAIIGMPGTQAIRAAHPFTSFRYCEIRERRKGIGDIIFPTPYSGGHAFWNVPQIEKVVELLTKIANA